jgi:hypothetical protein
MLRERAVGESLWESVLPAELRELPEELARVDAILADDRFLACGVKKFDSAEAAVLVFVDRVGSDCGSC